MQSSTKQDEIISKSPITSKPQFTASNATSLPSKAPVAFVSGHMDVTPEQFKMHYIPRLNDALSQGHQFIIGDAKGLDGMALDYLLAQTADYPNVRENITVHVSRPYQVGKYQSMGVKTICNAERYNKKDPRARHLNRDAGMTRASNYDILWVRSEPEARILYGEKWRPRVSATELNRRERLEMQNT